MDTETLRDRILNEDRKKKERILVRDWVDKYYLYGTADRIKGVPYRVCSEEMDSHGYTSENWQECEVPLTKEDEEIMALCKEYGIPCPFSVAGDKRIIKYNVGDARWWKERT